MINFLQHLLSIFSGIAAVAAEPLPFLAVLGSAITLVSGRRQIQLAIQRHRSGCVPSGAVLLVWREAGHTVSDSATRDRMVGRHASSLIGCSGTIVQRCDRRFTTWHTLFNVRSTVFAPFYGIAYLFVTPPVSADQLPIATIGKSRHPQLHQRRRLSSAFGTVEHRGLVGLESTISYEINPTLFFPALQGYGGIFRRRHHEGCAANDAWRRGVDRRRNRLDHPSRVRAASLGGDRTRRSRDFGPVVSPHQWTFLP